MDQRRGSRLYGKRVRDRLKGNERPVKSPSAPDQLQWYLDRFELFERSLNGETTSPVHQVRRAAIARFAEVGLPASRDEEWRHG